MSLSDPSVRAKICTSTQNRALCVILFLYADLPGRQIGNLANLVRTRLPKRLPVILKRDEVKVVMSQLHSEI